VNIPYITCTIFKLKQKYQDNSNGKCHTVNRQWCYCIVVIKWFFIAHHDIYTVLCAYFSPNHRQTPCWERWEGEDRNNVASTSVSPKRLTKVRSKYSKRYVIINVDRIYWNVVEKQKRVATMTISPQRLTKVRSKYSKGYVIIKFDRIYWNVVEYLKIQNMICL